MVEPSILCVEAKAATLALMSDAFGAMTHDTIKEATKDDILDGLEWIERETTSRDVAMVFLSGHGTNDAKGNYNFLPQDGNPARLHRTGIDNYIFKKFLV